MREPYVAYFAYHLRNDWEEESYSLYEAPERHESQTNAPLLLLFYETNIRIFGDISIAEIID